LWLLVVFVSACNERGDDAAASSDSVGATSQVRHGQARPESIAIDSAITIVPGLSAKGTTYEIALAQRVLPDEPPTIVISLTPSDTIDTANYQAAGWWLGYNDSSARGRWRFSADFERFASGVLVLRLDTLLFRDQLQPPFSSARADSIAVGGLREKERLATRCSVVGYHTDDRILGLMPDSSSERWMTPRMAWLVDTVASRFRRISTDVLTCWRAPNPD
jgi:hypothetical protein